LSGEARAQLELAVPVELAARQVIQEAGMPALHAYFPVNVVVSLVATMEDGASAEIAMVGREGMIGIGNVLGPVASTTTAVVQVGGTALRVPTTSLRAARRAWPAVARVLDLYTEAQLIQIAQTAACHRLHSVEARLARWLLGVHDRITGDEFVVAHESIADMLGVHRPTVSTVLHRFQEQHAIVKRGRAIVLSDRAQLESLACECYQVIRATSERVISRGAGDAELSRLQSLPGLIRSDTPTAATLDAMRDIASRLLMANIREQEAREAADVANRSKNEFFAMVSDELRTPLNAILGWCAILHAQKEQAIDRGLPIIERNARAQLKLIEDLLDTARLTSETLAIQRGDVSLQELLNNAVDTMTPVAKEKGVTLHLAGAEQVFASLFADADRLRQVLLNVLTNALKFTDAGGRVDVRVRSESERVWIIVQDTGRGISAAVLPHVFERFRHGSAPDVTHAGLGLGLTISRALIELHGGTMEIESPGENQGTTCTIALPLPQGTERARSGES
jgi:signal transduction histidine kinase/CRP-like cAMP-binding protein